MTWPPVGSPPRLICVTTSKVGVTAASRASLERNDHVWLLSKLMPAMKRFPFESTSGIPHAGELGRKIGPIQLTPPSVDRLNCRPQYLLPEVLQHWYWKPCPLLLVLSMVNHFLPPPV